MKSMLWKCSPLHSADRLLLSGWVCSKQQEGTSIIFDPNISQQSTIKRLACYICYICPLKDLSSTDRALPLSSSQVRCAAAIARRSSDATATARWVRAGRAGSKDSAATILQGLIPTRQADASCVQHRCVCVCVMMCLHAIKRNQVIYT